jgi:hypothetical protein
VQLLPDPPGSDGAIAQLGERLVCNQKVAGSIPAGSTTLPPRPNTMTRDDASPPERVGSHDRAVRDERIVCSLTIW